MEITNRETSLAILITIVSNVIQNVSCLTSYSIFQTQIQTKEKFQNVTIHGGEYLE